jgi:hypothetical protein
MATIAEKMEAIADKMEYTLEHRGDAEADHGQADELLLEALGLMTNAKTRTSPSIRRICTAYKALPKYYS